MFEKKNVLVSGGSRGIGRAIVVDFVRQGANVVFTYNNGIEAATALEAELSSQYPGRTVRAKQCDARDEKSVAVLVDETVDALGGIHILVNNAGITRDGLMVSMSRSDWDDVIDTNLSGVFNMTRGVIFQMMKQRGGSVINITSVAGVHGNAGQVNYSSAKAGLIGFTKSLSKEVVGMGIRVNAVAPGFIQTDMTAALSEAQMKKVKGMVGMRRMGQADEIAKAVSFLASEDANYITGQVLAVDGGIVI